MDRRRFGESRQRRRLRPTGDRGRQLEERVIVGLARLAHEIEPELRTAAVVLDQAAEDGGLGPELRAAGRAQGVRQTTGGLIVAQQQRHLGGTARKFRIGGRRRQVIDQRLGGVQIAHRDQPLDPGREHAARFAGVAGRTGHEQAPRQVAQWRHKRDDGQIRQQLQDHIRVGILPERPVEPAFGRSA